MDLHFNPYEVFEIALQIEKNGAAFYRSASLVVEDESAKDFLGELSDMECQHESIFSELMHRYKLEDYSSFVDLEDLSWCYLRAVAEGYVESHLIKTFTFEENSSIDDILSKALEFEKDSVVYFSALKSSMKSDDDKAKIEALILEEVSHINLLSNKMNQLR